MPKNARPNQTSAEQQRALDVESSFLEGLARRDPQWADALRMLGDNYTRRGRIRESLSVDERLAQLCPEDPCVFYNLACSHSRAGQLDEAYAALDRAIRLGYADFQWLNEDPDLAGLRQHPIYKKSLAKLEARKQPLRPADGGKLNDQ